MCARPLFWFLSSMMLRPRPVSHRHRTPFPPYPPDYPRHHRHVSTTLSARVADTWQAARRVFARAPPLGQTVALTVLVVGGGNMGGQGGGETGGGGGGVSYGMNGTTQKVYSSERFW
eukprot:COSAG05_NODE_1864_length_3937_cov_21.205315_3_plen_117_part_00